MSAGGKKPLAPGEVRVLGKCPEGHINIERGTSDGRVERGFVVPGEMAVIPLGRVSLGSRSEGEGTSRPARVNSEAYRSGWDAIFAKPAGKKAKERPN